MVPVWLDRNGWGQRTEPYAVGVSMDVCNGCYEGAAVLHGSGDGTVTFEPFPGTEHTTGRAVAEKKRGERREFDEERRMLDETRERCKALESELSSARMRIDKPLRDAWLGEAIAALAERVVAYRPSLVRTDWPEKCPDCNEDRKIAFTSPQGNAYTETCQTCGVRIVEYQPVEYVLASVRKRFRYESGADGTEPCDLYYAPSGDDDIDGASRFDLENVVAELPEEGGMPSLFKTQHEGEDDCYPLYSDTLFCDKRDCQTACDWINSREGYPRRENYRWWEANRHGRSEGAKRR